MFEPTLDADERFEIGRDPMDWIESEDEVAEPERDGAPDAREATDDIELRLELAGDLIAPFERAAAWSIIVRILVPPSPSLNGIPI